MFSVHLINRTLLPNLLLRRESAARKVLTSSSHQALSDNEWLVPRFFTRNTGIKVQMKDWTKFGLIQIARRVTEWSMYFHWLSERIFWTPSRAWRYYYSTISFNHHYNHYNTNHHHYPRHYLLFLIAKYCTYLSLLTMYKWQHIAK